MSELYHNTVTIAPHYLHNYVQLIGLTFVGVTELFWTKYNPQSIIENYTFFIKLSTTST